MRAGSLLVRSLIAATACSVALLFSGTGLAKPAGKRDEPRREGKERGPGRPDGHGQPPHGPDGRGPDGHGPHGGPDGPGHGPMDRPITPEEIKQAAEFFKGFEPEAAARLGRLMKEGGPGAREEVRRFIFRYRELQEFKKNRPEQFEAQMRGRELERKAHELGEKARRLKGPEREKAIEELHRLVAEQFELRQKQREAEIQEIERRLQELKAMQEKRRANQDALIEQRVRQMAGMESETDW